MTSEDHTLLEPRTPRSGGARRKDGESDRATQLEVARTIALDLLTARQRSAHELRAGLLRRRRLVGGLAAAIWLVAAADLVADGAVTGDSVTRWLLLRFGVTFAAGVLLFLWADRVPWPGPAPSSRGC